MNDQEHENYVKITDDWLKLCAAVERVRELHKQISGPYDDLTCKTCAIDVDNYPEWPCPTIKALDGEK